MKYKDEENGLYVVIDALVLRKIESQAREEYPNENGGMLAGRYSDDNRTVWVERVITPIGKRSTRRSFERVEKLRHGLYLFYVSNLLYMRGKDFIKLGEE